MFTCDNVLPQGVHAEEVDGLQHSLQSQQQVGPVGQVDEPLHAFPRVVGSPGLHHPAQQNPGHVVGSPEDPPTAVQRLAGALWDIEMAVTDAGSACFVSLVDPTKGLPLCSSNQGFAVRTIITICS